jgi:hypothetical protein
MEVFRSSDSELATFCKLWAKMIFYLMLDAGICSDLTLESGFHSAKVGHRIRLNVEADMGVPNSTSKLVDYIKNTKKHKKITIITKKL